MKSVGLGCLMAATFVLSACGAGFAGPPRLVRLSHIDGSVRSGDFNCVNGVLTSPLEGAESVMQNNLSVSFSAKVCASLSNPADAEVTSAMLQSGMTLVKVRCNDYFNAKQTHQGGARLARSLIQPLSVAITGAFSVITFGSERRESDALALLAVGTAAANSGIDIYEDQFLFGADNVYSVRDMTLRALKAHQDDIEDAVKSGRLTTFDKAARTLVDHQNICTPGNILELVRASIDAGTFRARARTTGDVPAAAGDGAPPPASGTIQLSQPPVG